MKNLKNFLSGVLILLNVSAAVADPTATAADVQVYESQQIYVPIIVQDFQSVTGFDLIVTWDSTVVSLAEITETVPGFIITNSGAYVRISHFGSEVSVDDDRALIGLLFTAIAAPGSVSPVDLSFTSFQNLAGQPVNAIAGSITILHAPVIVEVASASGVPGDEILIPVTVQNFNDVINFHVDLHWDTTVIEYLGAQDVQSSLVVQNYNGYGNNLDIYDGNSDTVSLADGTLLCNLQFRLKNAGRTLIDFGKGYASVSTYGDVGVQVIVGSIQVSEPLMGAAEMGQTGTEMETRSNISTFPNPVTDFVVIDAGSGKRATIGIFDKDGNLLDKLSQKTGDSGTRVDMRSYPKGTYLIKVYSSDRQQVVRVSKD